MNFLQPQSSANKLCYTTLCKVEADSKGPKEVQL